MLSSHALAKSSPFSIYHVVLVVLLKRCIVYTVSPGSLKEFRRFDERAHGVFIQQTTNAALVL
jgi:hypothetical protein